VSAEKETSGAVEDKDAAEALYRARENWFANSRLPPKGSVVYWPGPIDLTPPHQERAEPSPTPGEPLQGAHAPPTPPTTTTTGE
jgi:hypothetical protein